MKDGVYSISDLFESNRIFLIPEYQRNYAWEENQLKDFFNDLLYTSPEKSHFMGTLILRDTGKTKRDYSGLREFKIYEVIDGQQRLTTISIFIQSAIESLKNKNLEDKYIEELSNIFISKSGLPKLNLLGADKQFFENYIIKGQKYPAETLTPSQKRLKQAKLFFEEKLKNLPVDEIKNLISKLSSAKILVYIVKEKGEAMLMFETINNRGKPLSNLEKTKSFLMYIVYTSIETANFKIGTSNEESIEINEKANKLLETIDGKFKKIYYYVEQINEKYSKDIKEDDIQRYHWTLWSDGEYKSSFKYIDKLKTYFRELSLNNKSELLLKVEDYITSLEAVFYAFKELFVERIKDFNKLNYIVSIGRIGNFYPLLLSTWIKKKDNINEFIAILNYLEKFVFRVFLVGNKRSDTGINHFYRLAHAVFNNKIYLKDVYSEIKETALKYVSDSDFVNELKHENFYNRHSSRDIRYILYHYELNLRRLEGEPLSMDLGEILSDNYSIEHILAQNLNKEYRPIDLKSDEEFNKYINKLGNLVLCSRSWNSSMGNKTFKEKKDYYKKSIFKCQQELAKFEKFSKEEIITREEILIKWIKENWSFND